MVHITCWGILAQNLKYETLWTAHSALYHVGDANYRTPIGSYRRKHATPSQSVIIRKALKHIWSGKEIT